MPELPPMAHTKTNHKLRINLCNMEANKDNTTLTVSEATREIYELHEQLITLRDRVDSWHQKEYGFSSDFYEKLALGFDAVDNFIMGLLVDIIKDNVYNEKGLL